MMNRVNCGKSKGFVGANDISLIANDFQFYEFVAVSGCSPIRVAVQCCVRCRSSYDFLPASRC